MSDGGGASSCSSGWGTRPAQARRAPRRMNAPLLCAPLPACHDVPAGSSRSISSANGLWRCGAFQATSIAQHALKQLRAACCLAATRAAALRIPSLLPQPRRTATMLCVPHHTRPRRRPTTRAASSRVAWMSSAPAGSRRCRRSPSRRRACASRRCSSSAACARWWKSRTGAAPAVCRLRMEGRRRRAFIVSLHLSHCPAARLPACLMPMQARPACWRRHPG